jgi:hypothetical protein
MIQPLLLMEQLPELASRQPQLQLMVLFQSPWRGEPLVPDEQEN